MITAFVLVVFSSEHVLLAQNQGTPKPKTRITASGPSKTLDQQFRILRKLSPTKSVNQTGMIAPSNIDTRPDLMEPLSRSYRNHVPWMTTGQIKPGDIGRLRYPVTSPESVDDRDQATVLVMQVVGPNDVIVEFYNEPIWISGIDTSSLTDNSYFILDDVLEYSNNKTYKTAGGGSRTIKQLRVTAMTKTFSELRDIAIQKPLQKDEILFRVWVSKENVKLVGRIESFKKGNVAIKKQDGTTIIVAVKKLSKVDKKYAAKIRKHLK